MVRGMIHAMKMIYDNFTPWSELLLSISVCLSIISLAEGIPGLIDCPIISIDWTSAYRTTTIIGAALLGLSMTITLLMESLWSRSHMGAVVLNAPLTKRLWMTIYKTTWLSAGWVAASLLLLVISVDDAWVNLGLKSGYMILSTFTVLTFLRVVSYTHLVITAKVAKERKLAIRDARRGSGSEQ